MNWDIIYQECNNHLRTQDNKRDQIFAFFFVVVSLLFSNYNDTLLHSNIFLCSYTILNIFAMIILIKYRIWHERYLIAARICGIIMCLGNNYKKEDILDLYRCIQNKFNQPRRKY